MPDPVTQRLFEVLSADAVLAGQISSYAGVPAVFTMDPVPEDAQYPYVWVRSPSQNFRTDTLDKSSRTVSRDIVVFALAEGDPTPVDDIAWRVRAMFDDAHGRVLINGFGGMADPAGGSWYPIMVDAGGPIEANSDTDTYGRSVDLTIMMERV